MGSWTRLCHSNWQKAWQHSTRLVALMATRNNNPAGGRRKLLLLRVEVVKRWGMDIVITAKLRKKSIQMDIKDKKKVRAFMTLETKRRTHLQMLTIRSMPVIKTSHPKSCLDCPTRSLLRHRPEKRNQRQWLERKTMTHILPRMMITLRREACHRRVIGDILRMIR